jgi:SH3 domain-containing protein
MTRLRATAPHQIPGRPPIQVVPGQHVRVGRRDTEWPAFVFITTGTGSGWVPERYLDTSSDPAAALTGYDTTELATTAGEELILIVRDDPSGWVRVRNAAGSQGWVPLRTVEPVPGD